MKAARKTKWRKPRKLSTCPVCSKVFVASVEGNSGRTKLTCSDACKWKRINRIRNGQPIAEAEYRAFCAQREAARKAKWLRVCAVCGKEFQARSDNPHAKCCSRSCGNRLRYRKPTHNGPDITFCPKVEPVARDSYARVRAYLALPAAERYAQRDTLTKAEHALAQKLWHELHADRATATLQLAH